MTSTKFNWRCVYCQKRNIEHVAFQFDIPKSYTAVWCCSKCGKENEISFYILCRRLYNQETYLKEKKMKKEKRVYIVMKKAVEYSEFCSE